MPNGPNPAPRDPSDLALMKARRFMRRIKHSPFVALVVDEGKDRVHLFHTTGIDKEALDAIRAMLDEVEANLPGSPSA